MLPPTNAIAALVPEYSPSGDTTKIITVEGKMITSEFRIKSIVNKIAVIHAVDLRALRRNVGRSTGRSLCQPLPIAPGVVLIPVRLRKPKIAGDTCTGYLNFHAVEKIGAHPSNARQSSVTLTGGTEIQVLWSLKTLTGYLNHARLAKNELSPQLSGHANLQHISQKLVELIYEILTLKQQR